MTHFLRGDQITLSITAVFGIPSFTCNKIPLTGVYKKYIRSIRLNTRYVKKFLQNRLPESLEK
jgi:hypothetical protein